MNLLPATYKVLYNNKNITRDITDHLISLTYNDKVAGESDELTLSIEDSDLLWQNDWYPTKGARLEAWIQQDGLELSCGAFSIDEIELTMDRGGGDVVNISALAAFITKKMRTKGSSAHSKKSLREICNTIAAKHGLTVQGKIENIVIGRVTQYQETDLGFLHRIASDYGYTFSVRDNKMIFTSVYDLESHKHILTIDKSEITAHSIKDKTVGTYKKATVKHHNPKTNKTIDASYDKEYIDEIEDEYDIKIRVENKQQAEVKSKAALHKKNSLEKTGNIAMAGNVLMVAGINFELTGMGALSGIQHIISSSHTIDRGGGYVCTAEIKAVGKVDKSKWKPKKKKQKAHGTAQPAAADPNKIRTTA